MEVPGFFMGGGYFGAGAGEFLPDKKLSEQKSLEQFTVDDLLDFPNDDAVMADGFFGEVANSGDSSTITPVDSCNSSVSGGDHHHFSGGNISQFANDLCGVPYDEMAELEWLSNFVEDSFSTKEDIKALQLVTGAKPPTPETSSSETRPDSLARNTHIFHSETPLPGKARSKRSRAAPCDWSTRLLHLSSDAKPPHLTAAETKKRDSGGGISDSSGRKCLHCATEKTPQWRTGPMGPKTLCNACGVRFKSGRLVPEYRPAASPTFVSAKHSNSHRKVLELRRQKDMQRAQHHQQFLSQSSIFGVSNGADEFLIHHHNGPDYRHMI